MVTAGAEEFMNYSSQTNRMLRTIALISAGLLFLALVRLPIGYYMFLRLAITTGSVVIIYHRSKEAGLDVWVVLFGLLAIVFNPIWPVYLNDRQLWVPINVVGGVLFIAAAIRLYKPDKGA